MRSPVRNFVLVWVLAVAISLVGATSLRAADEHVVSPADLHAATLASAQTRQQNLDKVQKFLSAKPVRQALQSARLDPARVQKAAPTLSDQELARLASKADKAQADFAAGALTNEQLTYIAIALGAAVIVLIATR